ncbi:MAG: SpoIID/LytB domain-containing protein [Nitrospiraceae bacterium]
MRPMLLICTLAVTLLMPSPGQAAEFVRVLIWEDAQRLDASAKEGALIQFPNGAQHLYEGVIQIRLDDRTLVLNGKPVAVDWLMLRARGGDLTVRSRGGSRQGMAHAWRNLVLGGFLYVTVRDGNLVVVNDIELEEYVFGVVPSEMNADWHVEALKVQAVTARTYALYRRMTNGAHDYDLVATTKDQVYRGRYGVNGRVREAVRSTRGLVLTYQNAPILAAYSSTAAGPTEDARNVWSKALPYLEGVECPFDSNSPHYQWTASFRIQDLEVSLREQGVAVGTIASVTPFAYSRAGRVTKVRILHSNGELILRGEDLRRTVGYKVIRSTLFEVESVGREVVLSGRGYGHAVGLCQWGAKELATLGYSYSAILAYYYPETTLRDLRKVRLSAPHIP